MWSILHDLFGSRIRESLDTVRDWDEEKPIDRKEQIYKDLEGLERGEAIRLLNSIVLEQLAQDPSLSLEAVKKASGGFGNVTRSMSWQDIAYMSSSAIEYYLKNAVFEEKDK